MALVPIESLLLIWHQSEREKVWDLVQETVYGVRLLCSNSVWRRIVRTFRAIRLRVDLSSFLKLCGSLIVLVMKGGTRMRDVESVIESCRSILRSR